jgi:hypothetical protein
VAQVATRRHVVEVQPQVRTALDRDDVFTVKVSLSAVKGLAERIENHIGRRLIKSIRVALGDNLWTPAAVDARPVVALKGEHSKTAMIRVVSAINFGSAAIIVNGLTVPGAGRAA